MLSVKHGLSLLIGLAVLGAVGAAQASDRGRSRFDNRSHHDSHQSGPTRHAVPELSAGAAGSGLVLIAGSLLVLAGRRRKNPTA